MKIFKLLFLLLNFVALSGFAQEFYPLNFRTLVVAKKVDGKIQIEANSYFLNEKGFFGVDDLTFVNSKTGERVTFSLTQKENTEEVRIDYYCSALDLSRFIKRIVESGLDKVNENLYEKAFSGIRNSIAIKRNVLVEGKKFNMLSLIVTEDVSVTAQNKKPTVKFPVDYSYPIQNSIFYFETNLRDDKNNTDEYFVTIKMSKSNKYPNKLEFLDDKNWRVTLVNKQTFNGIYDQSAYQNQPISFSFNINVSPPKVNKGALTPIASTVALYTSYDLKKGKNSLAYFKFFFLKSYDLSFYGNDIILTSKLYENSPIVAPVPSKN